MRKVLFGLVFLGLSAVSANASTLVGDTVGGFFLAPNVFPGINLFDPSQGGNPVSAVVVDPGVEFSFQGGSRFTANFGPTSLTLGMTGIFISIGDDLIYTFSDIQFDTGEGIGGVSITSTDFTGVTFGFTADTLTVNIPNQGLPSQFQSVVLEIRPAAVVPEPATLGLSAFGALALVGLARARRTR